MKTTIKNLVYFYRKRFRARRVQELYALIGIAAGVALLYAVQVSSTSLSASVEQLTKSFFGQADWQLVARDPHGINQGVAAAIRRSSTVEAVAPVLESAASVRVRGTRRPVTLVAADASAARLGGALRGGGGGAVSHLQTLAVPTGIADALNIHEGGTVTLEIRGRAIPVTGVAVLPSSRFAALDDMPIVVTSLGAAQDWTGLKGRVSRVYVRAQPGRERAVEQLLQRLAGDYADVRPIGFDTAVFAQAAVPNDQSTGLFAGISAFVGFLFAFNALLLIASQRRELIGALRRAGFKKPSVVRIVVLDALVLGIVATVVGLGLGEVLSRWVFPPTPGYLALAFPVGIGRVVTPQTVILAIGAGLLAAVLATLIPLRQQIVSRRTPRSSNDHGVDPQRQDRRSRLAPLRRPWDWRLLVVGVVACAALAAVLPVRAPGAAVAGMLALIASMMMLLPLALRGVLQLVDRVGRSRWRSSSVPVLAVGGLRSSTSRTVAVTAIAAVALFAVVAMKGSQHDLQRGLDQDVHELSSPADLWISASGASNALATTPFALDVVRRVRRVPQVATVHVQRGGFLDIGHRRVWVLAPPRDARAPVPTSQILAGNPTTAIARLRAHGWAAVSQALADDLHLHLGESFTLNAPQPTRLRLAAIISNLGWTPGTIVINADDYRRAWQSSDASALRVDLATDTTPQIGKQLVQHALGTNTGLTVETAADREQRQRATARQGLSRLTQIAYLVLGAAALAMAVSIAAMVLQRRRELAALKLRGITTTRIRRILLLETTVMLTTGCTTGAAYGLAGARLLDSTLTTVTGFPVSASIALPVAVLNYLILATIAFTIAAIASTKAARVPPRTAFEH